MKILYSASFRGRQTYASQIKLVLDTLESFKSIEVISPEKENFQALLPKNMRSTPLNPGKYHYRQTKYGIAQADACVFEVSHESFQIGHETTLAIQSKKPVLCLSSHEDFNRRIVNDYFFGAYYTKETISGIIQDFLAHVRNLSQAQRFNMFLYPHQLDYLEETAKQNNMNMSEYIRHLINLDKHQAQSS